MEKQFAKFEIALALKDLGFSERCLTHYNQYHELHLSDDWCCGIETLTYNTEICLAPLWQQVIDWLREKHSVHIEITCANFFDSYMNNYSYEAKCKVYKNKELDGTFIVRDEKNNHIFYSYEDARKQAILKAIEFIKSKRP